MSETFVPWVAGFLAMLFSGLICFCVKRVFRFDLVTVAMLMILFALIQPFARTHFVSVVIGLVIGFFPMATEDVLLWIQRRRTSKNQEEGK